MKSKKTAESSSEEIKDQTAPSEPAPETAAPQSAPEPPDPATELAQLQEKYIYLQAEYQNYRKRMGKELADTRIFATGDALFPFLTVFDYLAMAETAADKSDNIESIRQGLKMIIAQFNQAFDDLGLKAINAVGTKFDPNLHEAVANEASDTVPEGEVIKQWNCGFKLGERLLRPARVVVSSGAPQEKIEPIDGADAPSEPEA